MMMVSECPTRFICVHYSLTRFLAIKSVQYYGDVDGKVAHFMQEA